MKKIVRLISLFIFLGFSAMAQDELVGEPYSYSALNFSAAVPVYDMPAVDKDILLNEDKANSSKENPLRIGITHPVYFTSTNSGRVDILPNGDKVWRTAIHSEDAYSIDVIFSKFNIPAEATLYVYTPDHETTFGKFTAADTDENGEFVTPNVPGDEIIIEYYQPANASFNGELEISRIGHTYRDISNVKGYHGDAEGDCHINVICPEGDNWREQIRSVVLVQITASDGIFLCSGAMINNTRQDKTPYVYTADHCYSSGGTYKFYFEYQTNSCEGTTGIFNRVATGGEVVARSATSVISGSSDFMLLRITGELRETYRDNIYFAGWDRATNTPAIGVAIHHPGGDYKKLSFPRLITSASGYLADKFWTVGWYYTPNNLGVTEQGSSGSPLFNANKLIVGSLSNGSSACDYTNGYDNYGKISYSWTNNNNTNNARKLQPWLDPDNTGVTSLPGISYTGTVDIANQVQEELFQVYPNPSNGQVTIKGNFTSSNGICNVYDAMGKLVYSHSLNLANDNMLDLHQLSNGLFFIEIIDNQQLYRSKLMIVK